MNITETIIRLAAPYTAVAFDVFDTLLKRDVAKPTDLFLLQGKEFARRRIEAEARARAASVGEVSLAEIYSDPDLSGFDPAAECSLELKAAVPNFPVWRAVQTLRSLGKRIYFISDMYLPPEQISAMLTKCGYEAFDGGFVSCSYGVQKRSGALFRRFLHETDLKASQVLFVGDSWRADVVGASLAGIRAWHLPEQHWAPVFPEQKDSISGAIQSFLQNRLARRANEGEVLGFSLLGPLLVPFCRWLHDRCTSGKGGRLFFLARDMHLAREIYALLYPNEETYYLQVSRRSLCPALLEQKAYDLLIAALPRQQLTGQQIAEYCGTHCPEKYAAQDFDVKHLSDEAALYSFLQALHTADCAALTVKYLKQAGLRAGDYVVDIGSGGTTQLLLERLCGFTLHGLLLSGDERLHSRLSSEQVEVFLSLGEEERSLYWAGQPMLEKMISQDVGATVGYMQRNHVIEAKIAEQPCDPVVEQLQNGALAFARDWSKSVLATVCVPASIAIAPFLYTFRNPTYKQTVLLGNLQVEDGGVYSLAAPRTLSWYLLRPRQTIADFFTSRWKIGFLKRLFRCPLPYDRIYLAIKK